MGRRIASETAMDYPHGATPLDPDDLKGLKLKHVTTRGELDHLEQANIESGLRWLQRAGKIDVLTENSSELCTKSYRASRPMSCSRGPVAPNRSIGPAATNCSR